MEEFASIQELETLLMEWEREFIDAFNKANGAVLTSLESLIDRLALNGPATTDLQRTNNLSLFSAWRSNIIDLYLNAGLLGAVLTLAERMDQGKAHLNTYLQLIEPTFSPEKYRTLLTDYVTQSVNFLTGVAIDTTYAKRIHEIVSWHILMKANPNEVREAIRKEFSETSTSYRQYTQEAADLLHAHSRVYTLAVAEDLNLKHYYYMGTVIATTRGFCRERVDQVYTSEEVESWVNLTWSGKNPYTTKVTIYWYLGGYRCRHRLLPISQFMYNQFKSRT